MAHNPYAGGPQWPADSSPRQPRHPIPISDPYRPTSPAAWSSDSDDEASASNSSHEGLDHLSDLGADDMPVEPGMVTSSRTKHGNTLNSPAPPLPPRPFDSSIAAEKDQTALNDSEPLSPATTTRGRPNSDSMRAAGVPSVTEIGELHRQSYAVTETELKDPDTMSLHDSVIGDVEFSFNSTDSAPNLLSILTGPNETSTENCPQSPPQPTTLAIEINSFTRPQRPPWDSIPPKPTINTAQPPATSPHYLSLLSPIYQPPQQSPPPSTATRDRIESQPTYFPGNVGTFLSGLRRHQSTRTPLSQPQVRARAHSQMPPITIPVGRQTGPPHRRSLDPKSVSARPASYFPNNLFNRIAAPPRPNIAQQRATSASSHPGVGSGRANQQISIPPHEPQSPETPSPMGMSNDESQLYTPSTMPTTPLDTQPSSPSHPTDPPVYPKRVWNRMRKRITETWVGRPGEDSYTSLHPGSSIDALSALEERIVRARPHHRQSSLPDASEIIGSPTLPRHVFNEMPPTASPVLSRYPPHYPAVPSASVPANQLTFQGQERLRYPSTPERQIQQVYREPVHGFQNASIISDSNISRGTLDYDHSMYQPVPRDASGALLRTRTRVLSDPTTTQPTQPMAGQEHPLRRTSTPLQERDTLVSCTATTSVGHRVPHGTRPFHAIPDVVETTRPNNSEAFALSDAIPYPSFMQNYSVSGGGPQNAMTRSSQAPDHGQRTHARKSSQSIKEWSSYASSQAHCHNHSSSESSYSSTARFQQLKGQSKTLPAQLRNLSTEHASEPRTSLSTYPTPLVHRRSVNAHTVSTLSGGGYQSSSRRTPSSMRARPDGTDIYSETLTKGHRRPLNPPSTLTGIATLSSLPGPNVPESQPAPPLQPPPPAAQPTKRTLAMLKDLLMWPAHPQSRVEQTPGPLPAATNAPGMDVPHPAHTAVSIYESRPTPQCMSSGPPLASNNTTPGEVNANPQRSHSRYWCCGPNIRIVHRQRAEWRTLAKALDKIFPPGIHEPLYKICFILGFICPPLWWLATWCIPPPRDQIRITRENLRVRRLRQWNKRMAQLSLIIIPIVVFILLIRFKDYSNSPIPLPPYYEPPAS
ncbi:hypothetical protein H4R34_001316 [Dimargaris verticillata]|uniref:Uncharacterized protein n=1 Tax=Dimargaris verticillata TaxID=2761393 RepID=A0A9W8BA47_9FUNG|nr:hypothetical protein H4R34_001316 [Dimargaris verticillata]